MGGRNSTLSKRAKNEKGGWFYFIANKKGSVGAYIFMPSSIDEKKAYKAGRSLLSSFKKHKVSPAYCIGEITNGSLNLKKGNAKPALIKKFLKSKNSKVLSASDSTVLTFLKSLSFGGDTSAGPSATNESAEDRSDLLRKLNLNPDDFSDFTAAELRDLYRTEFPPDMPCEEEEDLKLEERQAAVEALLDQLEEKNHALNNFKSTMESPPSTEQLESLKVLEDELIAAYIDHAEQSASSGWQLEQDTELSEDDKGFYIAARNTALQLLSQQITTLQAQIKVLTISNQAGESVEKQALAYFTTWRALKGQLKRLQA